MFSRACIVTQVEKQQDNNIFITMGLNVPSSLDMCSLFITCRVAGLPCHVDMGLVLCQSLRNNAFAHFAKFSVQPLPHPPIGVGPRLSIRLGKYLH